MKVPTREDRQKIDMCRQFLANRGYGVYQKLVTPVMVAEFLGVTTTHVANLAKTSDFPKPYNILAGQMMPQRRSTQRYNMEEVVAWLESRRVEKEAA